ASGPAGAGARLDRAAPGRAGASPAGSPRRRAASPDRRGWPGRARPPRLAALVGGPPRRAPPQRARPVVAARQLPGALGGRRGPGAAPAARAREVARLQAPPAGPPMTVRMRLYLAGCLAAALLAVIVAFRRRVSLLGAEYRRFLLVRWRVVTFTIALVTVVAVAPYAGDPTWDYWDAAFMGGLTFATAPWALGCLFRAL